MRVLMCSRNYFPKGEYGGAQVSVAQLSRELAAQGHDIAVLNVDDHHHQGIHEPTGIKEYRLKLKNIYLRGAHPAPKRLTWHAIDRFGSAMDADYGKVLDEFKPDLINTHVMAGIGLGIWRAARKRSIPIVHRVSDYYLMCLNSGYRKQGANCDGVCASCRTVALSGSKRASGAVSHIIYVSEKIRSIYEEAGVFPSTTPTHIIHGAYQPKKPVASRNGLVEPPHLTLGFFGRLSPEKGIETLLATLRQMPSNTWRLKIGGEGNPAYAEKLKQEAAGLPVEFVGYQQPDDFYATVDVLIVSSLWHEPSGRVAFESGIHGVIPVVAERGGLPEMVGYGRRGMTFNPDDPETLLTALRELLDEPLRAKIQEIWSREREEYLPGNVAARTLEIYRRVLAENSGAG
jgi:glycosyltransferase involved in cell wall biosynthesis